MSWQQEQPPVPSHSTTWVKLARLLLRAHKNNLMIFCISHHDPPVYFHWMCSIHWDCDFCQHCCFSHMSPLGSNRSSCRSSPPSRGSWAPPAGRRRWRRPLWWRKGPLLQLSPGPRSPDSSASPLCPPPPPAAWDGPAHCTGSRGLSPTVTTGQTQVVKISNLYIFII